MTKLWPVLWAAVILTGCTTAPAPHPASYWAEYLDPKAGVIGQIKTAGAAEALAPLLADKDLKDVLGRTTGVYFSLKVDKTEAGKFHFGYRLLALGDYPLGWTAFYLGMQSTWKRVPGEIEQFQNPLAGVFALNAESGAVIAASETLTAANQRNRLPFPATYLQDLEKWDLALLFPNPGDTLLGDKLGRMIPMDFAQAVFQAKPGAFVGRVILKMRDEKAARAGFLLVKLAMGAWLEMVFPPDPTARLSVSEMAKNLTFAVEGDTVIVDGFSLPFTWVADLTAGLVHKKEGP